MIFSGMYLPLIVMCGFIVGVVINLIADYLPAQRHYHLASTSPFVSRSAVPPQPAFFPRHTDAHGQKHVWAVPLWSAVIAALMHVPVYEPQKRARHILTELGLASAVTWIFYTFSDVPNWPILMFYAAVLTLVVIIDVEYRWVFSEIILVAGLVAIFEAIFIPRVDLGESLRGGVYGLGVMIALYVMGIVFARLIGILTGRRVGRTVLGFGDVYIGMLGGVILGWSALWFALLIMILTGAIASLAFVTVKIVKTGRYRVFSAIPYGPYIVIGIATMLYVPQVVGLPLARLLHVPF